MLGLLRALASMGSNFAGQGVVQTKISEAE